MCYAGVMKRMILKAGMVGMLGLGAVSCDKVDEIKEKVGLGDDAPKERKMGSKAVLAGSPSVVKQWMDEPNVLVVVDYSMDGCPPCGQLAPILDKMAVAHGEKAAIVKLNISKSQKNAEYAQEQGVNQFPTLKFYLNGEEKKVLVGFQSEKDLERYFSRYTNKIDDDLTVKPEEAATAKGPAMERVSKDALPEGISRVVVPDDVQDLGDKQLPNKIFSPSGPAPTTAPAKPVEKK